MSSDRRAVRHASGSIAIAVAIVLTSMAPALPAAAQQSEDVALLAFRSGRYEEAINSFRQRTRVAQAGADDHRNLVAVLVEVGRYGQAEAAARAFIDARPQSVELHNSLGEVLWSTGRLDEAENAFQAAVTGGAADRLTAELNLGIAAFDRGRRVDAMRRFDRFIDLYNAGEAVTAPDLIAVGIACTYLGIADDALFQDALRAFDEAVEADPGNLRPRILSSTLFLDKYDSPNAMRDLAGVLQLNPQQPQALLANARRMQFDNEPGAAEMADSALSVNPNLVEARVFRARQLLNAERFDEAIDKIEPALEVNPTALDALAILAATHYLKRDIVAFERIRDRVLALNPLYADLYNTVADLAVQHRLYAQAVDFAHQAIAIDPQSWRAYNILGVNQMRIGDIDGGRASLETSFAGDGYNIWVLNTLDLLDTFPDYVESSSERFDFMIEGPEAGLLSLYLGLLAEEAYTYFEGRYGYSPPTPIRIEVYPSHPDFSVRTVGLDGLGALGVSFGPVIAIDSPSARPIGEFNWGTTVWHEIAHTFTLGTTDFLIPRWFSEGLSVYEERRAKPSWGDDASASFLITHLRSELLPVSRVTDGFVRPSYPEQVIHSYYQASLVCELIDRDWGFEGILGLLDAYKRGLSTEDAFQEVLGMQIEDFDTLFSEYLDAEFAGPLAALRGAAELDTGESRDTGGLSPSYLRARADDNPGDFGAQLTYGIALYDEQRYEEATAYLETAKRLFPAYAELNSPYWYLAMIAAEAGDSGRAAQELEALTGINEKHYAANVRLAEFYEELGLFDEAAAALERTIYIYPLEIDMHQKLATLYETTGDLALAVRERQAVVARAPVDMADALYRLALAQRAAGDNAAAKSTVLGALEIAPGYPAAQDLLLELIGGAREEDR